MHLCNIRQIISFRMGKHDSDRTSLTNRKDKKESTTTSTSGRRVDLLSDSVKSKIEYGKERALKRWKLKFGPRSGPRTGDRVLNRRTKISYDVHFKGIVTFCYLVGDYDSSLILDPFCLKFAPSMKVATLVLYLQYKFQESHEYLTDTNGLPILDVEGKPIYCTSSWNDPGNADHFRAAVNAVHEARGNRGEYMEPCDDCCELDSSNRYKGCPNHAGRPEYSRKGNPTNDPAFRNAIKQVKKNGETYKIHGCDQLMPGEVRQIATYLRSSNNLKHLQTLLVMLLSIKTFLRGDDLGIKIEDFETNLCQVNETGPINLCFNVKGKSDHELVYLYVWSDDDCPDFCALRVLLVYVFLTGIESGPLFFTDKEANASRKDESCKVKTTQISYETVKTRLQFLFNKILQNFDKCLGVHTLRKTAYLFAKFGHADLSDTMSAARHKNIANAMKYEKDCGLHRDILEAQPDPLQRVSKFKAVRCLDPKAAKSVNLRNKTYLKSLPQLASDFVHVQLKIDRDDPKLNQPRYLMDKALAWRRDDDALGSFNKLMDELNITNQDCRDRLVRAADCMSEERLRTLSIVHPGATTTLKAGTSILEGPTDTEMQDAVGSTSRKRGTGSQDLEGRLQVSHAKTTLDKINIMLGLQHLISNEPEKCLTSGALTFYKKYMRKLQTCLDSHFTNGDTTDRNGFCAKYPNYSHTKWTCTCII